VKSEALLLAESKNLFLVLYYIFGSRFNYYKADEGFCKILLNFKKERTYSKFLKPFSKRGEEIGYLIDID